MHFAVMQQQQAELAVAEKDLVARLGTALGVGDAERRVNPELPATVRFGDPNLAELFERQARMEILREAVTKVESVEPSMEDAPTVALEEVDGIGPELAEELARAGINSPEDVRNTSDEELLAVAGIGPAKLRHIRSELGKNEQESE